MKKLFELVFIIFFSIQLNAKNGCIPEFSVDSFKIELKKIQAHDFDEAKKEAIETLFEKCLTSLQLKQLLQELSFEEDKLDLATKAFNKISDPENYGVIKVVFDFEESKKVIDGLSKQ